MAQPEKQRGDGVRRGRTSRRRRSPPPDELARLGRFLLESAKGYALISLDVDGTIRSWSTAAEEVFGWTSGEAVGRPASIIFTPEDIERGAPEAELRTVRERGRADDQRWHVRKDGRRFWGSGMITELRDDRGRLAGYAKIVRDLTEEKEAAQRLRASEERWRIALEAGRMGTWEWIVATDEVRWSETLERMHGIEPSTFAGTFDAFTASIHPDDRERVVDAVNSMVRERRRDYEISYRIIRPDGSIRWLDARGRMYFDSRGEPTRMLGIATDGTIRHEAEQRQHVLAEIGRVLASSLDYGVTLRWLAELAVPQIADGCAVYVVDDGRLESVAVNHTDPRKIAVVRELERRYPPDPDASIGAYHVLRTREPELFREVSPELVAIVSRDDEHHRLLRELDLRSIVNVPLVARDRTLGVLTLVMTEPGRRYDHGDVAFAETVADRAASAIDNARLYGEAERRAREEEALRRAAETVTAQYTMDQVLRQIAASALAATEADGAFVERLDADVDQVEVVAVAGIETPPRGTRIAYAGSFAARIMERGRAELVPRLADVTRTLSPALIPFPDSSAVVVPLLDAGDAIGALFLLRKRGTPAFRDADLERAATFGRLASLAFRKVRLLEESERRREELERVMESRAHLVRGFSHDVKNPLGAADGHLELLEGGVLEPLRPRQAESVHRARASLRSALDLIDELVDLARVQAGRFSIEPAPVDVRDLVRDVAREYQADAESVGLTLSLDLPPEIPLIHSDPIRLRQIMGNLLSNAVKYTPEGGRISVRIMPHVQSQGERGAPAPGEWLAIDVSDTGPGIPAERRDEIFGEFTRLEPGRERGAGLGLAISRRLARLLGGDLTVESEPGAGSTFTLWLPIDGPPPGPTESEPEARRSEVSEDVEEAEGAEGPGEPERTESRC